MKPLSEFYPNKQKRDGLFNVCKLCVKASARAWGEANPERKRVKEAEWRAKNEARLKLQRQENREARYANWKRWAEENRERLNARVRVRRAATPELQIANRKRRQANPEQNIASRMRSRIRNAFRIKGHASDKAGRAWRDLVGYSVADLRVHIERQFTGSMSWENFGKWHIDHIVPVSSFSFSSVDDPDFRACWALTNLRPIWKKRNLSKAAKVLTLL